MKVEDFRTELSVLGSLYDETISSILRSRAAELGDSPALAFDDRTFSYRELLAESTRFCKALESIPGTRPGDRVCVMTDNQWHFVIAFFGTILAGRIFVPLNTAYRRQQLEFVLGDVTPVVFVAGHAYTGTAAQALAHSAARPRLVVVDPQPGTSVPLDGTEFREFLRSGPHGEANYQPAPSTPMMILYTSGTTGQSKGIIYCHRAAIWFAGIACTALELSDEDVLHTCLPLFHANALLCTVLAGVLVGAASVVTPGFSLSRYWGEVASCGATVTSMLGTMQALLWQADPHPDETAHRLRLAYAAPLPAGIVAQFQDRFGLSLATTYGLTDASILTVGRSGPDVLSGSCGQAFEDWELRLVDDNDEPVAPGKTGEMIARPRLPHIGGAGYWNNPQATADAWANLWHHSGDLLAQDERGAYHFRERKKDSIRKAGENVASFEVEQVIAAFPGVDQVAVFAVPSSLGDDDIMAVVVPGAQATVDMARLRDHCRDALPYFAVPRYWQTADSLPLTETSRVKKSELRARGVTEQTWDSGPVRRTAVPEGAGSAANAGSGPLPSEFS